MRNMVFQFMFHHFELHVSRLSFPSPPAALGWRLATCGPRGPMSAAPTARATAWFPCWGPFSQKGCVFCGSGVWIFTFFVRRLWDCVKSVLKWKHWNMQCVFVWRVYIIYRIHSSSQPLRWVFRVGPRTHNLPNYDQFYILCISLLLIFVILYPLYSVD